MADESIWKKEVSFGRKSEPKDESAPETPAEGPAVAESAAGEPEAEANQETLWKREVSFEPKPAPTDPEAETETSEADDKQEPLWTKEISFSRKSADEPSAVEPVANEPVVEEPVAETPIAEEPVAKEPIAEQPVAERPLAAIERLSEEQILAAFAPVEEAPAAEDASSHDEQVEVNTEVVAAEPEPWNAPPVMPPAPEVPVVVHPPVTAAELPPAPSDEPQVPFWKKDISLGGKKREKKTKVDAPPSDESNVPFWKKDLSFGGKTREKTSKADTAPVTVSEPAAKDQPKVPFWKKDLSFGGKKREKPEVEPAPVPASDLPAAAAADQPTVPFWKKDLSLGKKRDKTPKVKAERKPKVKAERKPSEPKAPRVKQPKIKGERGAKGAKRVVGLKIGASQLAAARVSNNGTAELQQVARGPLEAGIVVGGELRDPDALSEALKQFFAAHGLPKRGVRLGIANNRIGVRTFEIAGIEDPKQLANAVRFRAQEALPIPIDEAVLDYQVLGEGVTEEGEPTRRILLVVAYRELIDRYVDACKKAGITLAGIDLEAFALLRALQAPQDGVGSDPTAALVVVSIGHERATFAVSDGRVCEFTRVLDWGGSALNVAIARVLDAAPSEVEGAKRALALTDEMVPEGLTSDQAKRSREAMRRAIQAFARELVSSLQYYQNQPGSLGIGEIVLTGGTAHLPGLAGELERLIGVRVRVGDPLARMKIAKRVGEPEQIGSLAVAIGLGIED
jgi:type IV pilus assembly protein PilM